MNENFDRAIEWLFRKEGGYSNDPSDYLTIEAVTEKYKWRVK